MKRTIALAVCAALAATAYTAPPADAAGRKIISENAGYRCTSRTAPPGTWVGWFHGQTESPMIIDNDALVSVFRVRCFDSETQCRDWVYTMQSRYSSGASRESCELNG